MGWWKDDSLPKPLQRAQTSVKHSFGAWIRQYASDDPSIRRQQGLLVSVACVTTFGLGFIVGKYSQRMLLWRRIPHWQDLPSSAIRKDGTGPTFRGHALQVSDGDTFRFYHVPTRFHSAAPKPSQKLSEQTWPVRVCTIDAPETPKFGKPGQAYGEESKRALSQLLGVPTSDSKISTKPVYLKILDRDQYGRAVAQVHVGWWPFRTFVDEVLLEKGLAEVYRGSGAVYGPQGLKHYDRLEDKARTLQKGIWSLGNQRESASEYKARTKS